MARTSIGEALAAVLEGVEALEGESVPLREVAGRVLARDVLADRDQPPFDRSAMDGFAVRAADTEGAPVVLRIVGEVQAGAVADRPVGSGETIRIMTGAPLPDGADAVQMVEKTEPAGDDVRILKAVSVGRHIAERGQDIRAGEVAVARGCVLTTARLGVCWSVGAHTVRVHRRPTVAILTTGDELVGLRDTPGPAQIRDSNRCTVGRICERAGARLAYASIVRDTVKETRASIRHAMSVADVVLTSGGVSAGDYDLVADCLQAEGVEKVFHEVHMKPGKPVWFGRAGSKPVFGLPGNPVSCQLTARLFAVPVLRRLGGRQRVSDPVIELPLVEPFRGTGDRPTFQPAEVVWGRGVRLLSTHGSGDQQHFAGGQALGLLPPGRSGFEVGEAIEVHLDEESLL